MALSDRRGFRKRFGHHFISTKRITFFRRILLRWFRVHGRTFPWRAVDASLYDRIVTEVLLQRTRAETVAAFWPTFCARYPNWRAIESSSVEEIEHTLRPIGLSKQRAPRLHSLARQIIGDDEQFSRDRNRIEQLPGVGQYIANAILTFAHNSPQPLLDTNMARIVERYFGTRKLADIRYDPYLQSLCRALIKGRVGACMNWAILDFAAKFCTARRPSCNGCPLSADCTFVQS